MKYLKPAFFIIGERKCGTSSLYRYLLEHPNVLPCKLKEPQFFVKKPWRIWWNIKQYYALFPTVDYQGDITVQWPELDKTGNIFFETLNYERLENQTYLTGEASAETFHRANPRILKHFLPDIKLIVMLRNPVERAYSHYRMLERFRAEGRSTKVPLTNFAYDMRAEMNAIKVGKKGFFLSPSLYIQNLERWTKVFSKDQLFVIRTEDMEMPKQANQLMSDLCQFLNLPDHDFSPVLHNRYNKAPKKQIPPTIAKELSAFFKPYNYALESYLGRKLHW
jgi:hypothetical protein